MFDMENSGDYIRIIELKNLLGINSDKDTQEYEDKLWDALYQLYLENEINFCKKDDVIDWIDNIRPDFDQTTGKVVKYDGALFKRREIANKSEKLKKMLGFDTQQAVEEEKQFQYFLKEYPEIDFMFKMYLSGKSHDEIMVALHEERRAYQEVAAFLTKNHGNKISSKALKSRYARGKETEKNKNTVGAVPLQ